MSGIRSCAGCGTLMSSWEPVCADCRDIPIYRQPHRVLADIESGLVCACCTTTLNKMAQSALPVLRLHDPATQCFYDYRLCVDCRLSLQGGALTERVRNALVVGGHA
jgi:hypothetical protein